MSGLLHLVEDAKDAVQAAIKASPACAGSNLLADALDQIEQAAVEFQKLSYCRTVTQVAVGDDAPQLCGDDVEPGEEFCPRHRGGPNRVTARPDGYVSPFCESGGRPGCTCDRCF